MRQYRLFCLIGLALSLSGCTAQPDRLLQCGTVSAYLTPPINSHYYRVVVTHLDGVPVISKPNYILNTGHHQFTVAELIDSPSLKVNLAARIPKVLDVQVDAEQRYHLAAKFNIDKAYQGNDTGYWQPVIWQQDAHECELPKQ